MDLELLRELIVLKGYSVEELGEETGVEPEAVRKILEGTEECPDAGVLYVLKRYFNPDEKGDMVHEQKPVYNVKRRYTLEDYYRLPDERRVELIDGKFYEMAAPSTIHQIVQSELICDIGIYIRKKGGSCQVFASVTDVQLDKDEYTMVQPDVLVVCSPEKITERCIVGAPDFVAEVLSPSTGTKDRSIKMKKYKSAGVREYWLIDPEKEHVIAYFFEADSPPAIYGMEDEIPVGIFGGDLKVCMKKLLKR